MEKWVILNSLILVFSFISNVQADKIYLQSGRILEGKIKEISQNSLDQWYGDGCNEKTQVEYWQNNNTQCLNKSDVVKVEKVFKKPEGIALLAKEDRWGKEVDGYKTQIIAVNDKYVIGEPMLFNLVMQNVSEQLKFYDPQGLAHPSFNIIGPLGKTVMEKVGDFQTLGSSKPIDKGEIVSLIENRDITNEYVIVDPGKYTIQFLHGWAPSNVIEFEIQPGQPKKEDVLITSLIDHIPSKCSIYQSFETSLTEGISIGIYCSGIHQMFGEIFLIATEEEIDINKNDQNEEIKISECLGKSQSSYIYFSASEKLIKFWPSIKDDVVKNLNIKK